MKLSKLVCEVVLLALLSTSEAAEPAKNETAASSQAAKPAAQTASVATPAGSTSAGSANQENDSAGQGAKAAAVPTDHGDVDPNVLGVGFDTEALVVRKNVELDIKNRQQNNNYKYLKAPTGEEAKFIAQYGTVFTKVKDGDLLMWDGKGKDFSVSVEMTSDYRVTVNLYSGKKKVFVKGYNRWVEHDPKEAEMQTAYDHSGFPVGWDLRGSLDEAEKKEGEDSKEGSKSGKSRRKVPGWGISLIAISATVLVVSIGVAVGVRMRK